LTDEDTLLSTEKDKLEQNNTLLAFHGECEQTT